MAIIWFDIINTAKLFKTMFSGKTSSQSHYSATQALCHGMPWCGCTQSRQAAMVMTCEGETVCAKQVCTDNRALPKWNVIRMSGRKQHERKKSFIKNKQY